MGRVNGPRLSHNQRPRIPDRGATITEIEYVHAIPHGPREAVRRYRRHVLGFELVRADGSVVRLEATDYEVTDDGSVTVLADDDVVLRAESGSWIEIRPVGRKLTPSWPPDSLDLLLDNLSHTLGVGYGHYTHRIKPASSYSSRLLNELESLTAAVLRRVDLDASYGDNRSEADAVRHIIRRHFHIRPPARRQQ